MQINLSSIQYDEQARSDFSTLDELARGLLHRIDRLRSSRSKAVALAKLEECHMFIGKAVRDDQMLRETFGPAETEGE
jgi:hypothetical protein